MTLVDELERIGTLAARFAEADEELAAVLPTEPERGLRVYLCAYARAGERTWLALDAGGRPLERRADVRQAVSIAALCEIAAETVGGGDLDELRSQLVALRIGESPPGIEEAEEAALALEYAVGAPPRLASAAYLDRVGDAARRLERALGDDAHSPFAQALAGAVATVEALTAEVERGYKRPLA